MWRLPLASCHPPLGTKDTRTVCRPARPSRIRLEQRPSVKTASVSWIRQAPSGVPATEWMVAEILPVDLQQVEDAVDDRVLGHLLRRRPGRPETLLESGEGRLVAVVGHHLPVEQEVASGLRRHRGTYLGVGSGEILAGTRFESHVAAHFACDAALAVELALQQPVVAEVATVGQRRQHQRHRHRSHSTTCAHVVLTQPSQRARAPATERGEVWDATTR